MPRESQAYPFPPPEERAGFSAERATGPDMPTIVLPATEPLPGGESVLRHVERELRTPLHHILGGVDALLQDHPDDNQTRWLGVIRRSAGDLLGMVNRMIDLAQFESSHGLPMESVAFDPRQVLDDVRAAGRLLAQRKGLEIVVLPTFTVPSTVVGSPSRLAQALLEYLDNAIKFTSRGRITLSAQLLGADARGYHLRFAVTDTGRGIDGETQATLFKPFSTANGNGTSPRGSLGNGLSVARSIARALGGEAGVDSVPGAGSTFWVTGHFAPGPGPAGASHEAPWPSERPGAHAADDLPIHPTPHFVTLGDFDVDRKSLRGSFRVALDELLLPERFHFAPGDSGWAEWVGPLSVFPTGGALDLLPYALDADTEAAVSRALHSAVPRLLPAGRDPLSGEVRAATANVAARAFDPLDFPNGLGRLATPGFTVTVSTLP